MGETLFASVAGLVFDGYTTTERDALDSPQERHVIFNTTTADVEVHLSGVWYPLLRLDSNALITSDQHGSIAQGYARRDVPDDLRSVWTLREGAGLFPQDDDATPLGEIGCQVKTATGAPSHSATRSTMCLVVPDNAFYINTDGKTTWLRLGAADELAHVLTFPYPNKKLAAAVFMPLPSYPLLTKLTAPGVEADQRFTVTANVAGTGTNTVVLESTTTNPFTGSPSWTVQATLGLDTVKHIATSAFTSDWVWDPATEYLRTRCSALSGAPLDVVAYYEWNP